MILISYIFRTSDGMPLCATTDIPDAVNIRACQSQIKLLSRQLAQYSDRCSMKLENYFAHFITASGLTFLVLCDESFPSVLAFSFLTEIQKEFLLAYSSKNVQSVRRPYAFIEFENHVQKIRHKFNNPRSLASHVNLADMSLELRLRPPSVIDSSVTAPSSLRQSHIVLPGIKLPTAEWYVWLVVVLLAASALINLARGMVLLGHGRLDDEEDHAYANGGYFLLAVVLSLFQVYQLFYITKWHTLHASCCLLGVLVTTYMLTDFRNAFQILFHSSTAAAATALSIYRRNSCNTVKYAV